MSGPWRLTGMREDIGTGEDRWILEFAVPVEYAPDGRYSASFPTDIVNSWAALFAYDVDDPEHLNDLFDHITYIAYVNEVLRREGVADEVLADPLRVDAGQARTRIKSLVEEFKRTRPILAAAKADDAQPQGIRGTGVFDGMRVAMEARVDRQRIRDKVEHVERARHAMRLQEPTKGSRR